MLKGQGCSQKCRNSLEVLQRQEQAVGLRGCRCEEEDEEVCLREKRNTARLCYGRDGEEERWVTENHLQSDKDISSADDADADKESGEQRWQLQDARALLDLAWQLSRSRAAVRTSHTADERKPRPFRRLIALAVTGENVHYALDTNHNNNNNNNNAHRLTPAPPPADDDERDYEEDIPVYNTAVQSSVSPVVVAVSLGYLTGALLFYT
ncbi:uncharacterized protein LOC129587535 [Paramacrobiotus metropolitanus]|uniref:uncharacterized protein LOC129587535 n=1 Tax=Paramacrobiotus metropolitanus TaxID=2943436 RepID=UPI0024460FB4|nr:uncharacterized protein LOC129587535 [Paramacrobiotus metropolitanus]